MTQEKIYEWLEDVPDPEIPAISIVELGVVRQVRINNQQVEIDITPTYSGCPAMKVIEDDIVSRLKKEGLDQVTVKRVLAPAWTTDWISDVAKEKMRLSGIAPPEKTKQNKKEVSCPYCNSQKTKLKSWFGTTACKSLYVCEECLQPFDHFKCI
ncbi:MAG: phenylacetate-CoA oxygenase subunit PaaJ [Cytophagales bacterium]|nr:MAG: phenylacetate-CoA oxygenase subunit PaaJ [Cytophagales bacterium]TAF62327.1 MAG: phenylacetate-CoA oxygenase subunit PaaJ [Cytophagales bacterium]